MTLRRQARAGAVAVLLGAMAIAGLAAQPSAVPPPPTQPQRQPQPQSQRAAGHWGAIAARPGGHGYAFDQPSRAVAEQVARAQCERLASPPAPADAARATRPPPLPAAAAACEVRVWFENGCGTLATGNFGEWGTATGADRAAADRAAVAQCDAHLPTEPCRVAASVCSLP